MADAIRGTAQETRKSPTSTNGSSGDEWDALRSDFSDMRKDVDRLLKALSAEQGDRLNRLRDRAGEAATTARDAGAAALDAASKQFHQSQEALGKQISGNPLASVGIAFAAGMMLAGLMRGRR